jgi:hypothetical protein
MLSPDPLWPPRIFYALVTPVSVKGQTGVRSRNLTWPWRHCYLQVRKYLIGHKKGEIMSVWAGGPELQTPGLNGFLSVLTTWCCFSSKKIVTYSNISGSETDYIIQFECATYAFLQILTWQFYSTVSKAPLMSSCLPLSWYVLSQYVDTLFVQVTLIHSQ